MIYGIGAGVLWALVTVVLSIVLSADVFKESEHAIFLAPFVSAFLNDTISGICLYIFRKTKKQYGTIGVFEALKKKNGKILILSGLLGGPLGMSTYLLSIKYIGTTYTAVISALYPALGAMIAWIFLKDKLSKRQLIGVFLCIFGSIQMAGVPKGEVGNIKLFLIAFACALFWGLEAVLSSYAMKKEDVSYETALQIRQGTSFVCYAMFFLPLLHAWGFTLKILTHRSILLLLVTAMLETGSYLLYYRAIHVIGASKAMTLNITYIIWSVLFGIVLLKKMPTGYELISIGIVAIGVFFVAIYGKVSKEKWAV